LLHVHFGSPFLFRLILIPYILQNPLDEDFLLNPFQKEKLPVGALAATPVPAEAAAAVAVLEAAAAG